MPINNQVHHALKQIFNPDQILVDPSECIAYSYDNSRLQALPDAVVVATEEQQILELVQLCRHARIPLTTRGRGTNTTGASIPMQGGIVLTLEQMQKIIDLQTADRYIIVQPGLTNQALQDYLADYKLFWAPDPSSRAYCSIGGNLACNSAGPRAIKYGTCRENTLGLTAVLGNGTCVNTGTRTTKGVVGYDLTRLLIGSEGTLGIISQAILKLLPKPSQQYTLQVFFQTIQQTAYAISQLMQQSVIPTALEFIDDGALDLLRNDNALSLPNNAQTMLMISIDGEADTIEMDLAKIIETLNTIGLLEINIARTQEQQQKIWQARKSLSPLLRHIAPKKINEDVVVPVSKLPSFIAQLKTISQKYQIPIINFGHAGNGNLHVNLLVDPDNLQQMNHSEACLQAVFQAVIQHQGTLSGEHGIGYNKKSFIPLELSPNQIHLMQQIKAVFDPDNILNPDKLFP